VVSAFCAVIKVGEKIEVLLTALSWTRTVSAVPSAVTFTFVRRVYDLKVGHLEALHKVILLLIALVFICICQIRPAANTPC
jgi:hypothetical protein